jgi:prolyl oligopeptidase
MHARRANSRLIPVASLVVLAGCGAGAPVDETPAPRPTAPAAPTAPAPPSTGAQASQEGPPKAPVRDVRDTYFGTEIIDPYRWMEAESPEFAAWMKAQSEYTKRVISAAPAHASLLARVRELNNAGSRVTNVQRWGGKIFSLEAEPGKDNYRLYVRPSLNGDKRLLVDPETLTKDGKHASIDYYAPSADGRYVAYGVSPSGSELAVLHVLETDTGKVLPDVIDRARYANVEWLDGRSFFYKRDRKLPDNAPATERFTRARVYLHVLGADPERDEPVFGFGVSPDIAVPDEGFPSVAAPAESPYLFAVVSHGTQPELSVYYAPRKAFKGAKTPWAKLVTASDEVSSFEVHKEDLYLLTHHKAPRSKLTRTSLKKPDIAGATTVVPEGEAVLTWLGAAKDGLYLRKLDGGVGRLFRMPWTGGPPELVDPGVEGSVRAFFVEPTTPGSLVRIDAWTASPRLIEYDAAKKKATITPVIPPSPVVFDGIVSAEVKAKSADGTLVPLSILHRRDLPRDGSSPTYLNGYGSYGFSSEPTFEPMQLAWLEKGGIIAMCHPRGGGEYGEEWHRAGKLATKPNTIADFIACARYLIDEKYTSPAHLAGQGTSAGGIMIGGAIVKHPELFGAAVMRVGMVNALRFEQIPIGPFNTAEFGSVTTKEGFDMLLAIDAYHKVKAGTEYPAVLLTTGITDTRVSPWQMGKMAARLQASTAGNKPVLLRVNFGAGHGAGSTKTQREEELADTYAFLLSQIGKR